MANAQFGPKSAKILEDEKYIGVDEATAPQKDPGDELAAWIMARTSQWKDHRTQNYDTRWDEYERLWQGIYSPTEKQRKTERSTIIGPALSEAVENCVAEVEEALFGRGDFFDIKGEDTDSDEEKKVVSQNKTNLKEDLDKIDYIPNASEALMNGAIYGTGIGEIVVKSFMLRDITVATQQALSDMGMPPAPPAPGQMGPMGGMPPEMMDPMLAPMGAPDMMGSAGPAVPPMGGSAPFMPPMATPALEMQVIEKEVKYACMHSVNPRNFLIDPNARTIDDALGCAIEEYVGSHIIRKGQEDGTYRKAEFTTDAGDQDILVDKEGQNEYTYDKTHVLRYYGLVPKHLLDKVTPEDEREESEELVDLFPNEEAAEEKDMALPGDTKGSTEPTETTMVEAVVVLANKRNTLKAVPSPYLMQDRPVVAFAWDIVPGRFWGRGVCEKGASGQKMSDAELRYRIDALRYSSAPMIGIDATRLPRGFKFEVYPGKSILTTGNPKDVLSPFKFGELDQNSWQQSQYLDQIVQRATGSLDIIALAAKGDTRPGSMSMMLSGIVKRHKRTLMNFINRFLAPSMKKIMWRNMQFYPERYTPTNFSFVPVATMGIMQREYEMQGLVQLLNTTPPESPMHKAIVAGVISNTGLAGREKYVELLNQQAQAAMQPAPPPDPMDLQLEAMTKQLAVAKLAAEVEKLKANAAESRAQAAENDAKARQLMLQPQIDAMQAATKGIYATPEDQQSTEFDRRMAIADRMLEAEDIASNERIATLQAGSSERAATVKAKADVIKEGVKASGSLATAQTEATAPQI